MTAVIPGGSVYNVANLARACFIVCFLCNEYHLVKPSCGSGENRTIVRIMQTRISNTCDGQSLGVLPEQQHPQLVYSQCATTQAWPCKLSSFFENTKILPICMDCVKFLTFYAHIPQRQPLHWNTVGSR